MDWYRDTRGMRCRFCGAEKVSFKELAKTGAPRYRCRGCKRTFQMMHCRTPPPCFSGEAGPFPHRKTFNLNVPASKGLAALCQAKGMSAVQAIRFVLYEAAGDAPPTPAEVGAVLSDIRPVMIPQLVARRMWGHRGNGLVVLVVERVRVCLNDRAKAGLVRTMRARRCDHQAAVRHLLAERLPPVSDADRAFRAWLTCPTGA